MPTTAAPPASGQLRGILDHALDAQSANDEQQRLLSNPLTPDIDSSRSTSSRCCARAPARAGSERCTSSS